MRISDWSSDVCSSDLQRARIVFLVPTMDLRGSKGRDMHCKNHVVTVCCFVQECLAAAWRFSCMYEYGAVAEDGVGYCRDSCIATLDSCESVRDLQRCTVDRKSTRLNSSH